MTQDPNQFGPEQPDPRKLGAWLDGELPAGEAAAFAASLRTDPELAREVAALRRTDGALRAAFGVEEPADAALLARLGLAEPAPAPVIDLAAARTAREAVKARRSFTPARIAASVAAVAVLGLSVAAWNARQPAAVEDAPYTALSDRTQAPRADALVVLQDGADAARVIGAAGGRLVGPQTSAGAWRVAAEPGKGAALLARLRADNRVIMAEPLDAGDAR